MFNRKNTSTDQSVDIAEPLFQSGREVEVVDKSPEAYFSSLENNDGFTFDYPSFLIDECARAYALVRHFCKRS